MIRKIGLLLYLAGSFLSCNKAFEQAIKSKDPNQLIPLAKQYNEQGKYKKASEILEIVTPLVLGTDQAKEVLFLAAQNSYADKSYLKAAERFKRYYEGYTRDSLAEEALFMAAKASYEQTPVYNRDQSYTKGAIQVTQMYIDRYPHSPRVAEANENIIALRRKLETKAFEMAKNYYSMGNYVSAATTFQTFVEDYPDSNRREEAYIYLLRSQTEVGINTFVQLEEKRENRLKEAELIYKRMNKLYPDSRYMSEAEKLNKKVTEELKIYQQ